MTITAKQDAKALTLFLEGRLDTVTAPELESAFEKALPGADSLVLNFEKLDYISSAGLRVLLSGHKQMSQKGGMKVTNANELVREVLDVTGFSDILTIE